MQVMSVQQAIYQLSLLTKEFQKLTARFYQEYEGPVRVDGKLVVSEEARARQEADMTDLALLVEDIAALKDAVAKSNQLVQIDGRTLAFVLESLRLKRQWLQVLETTLANRRTQVETGVGVVEYGPLNSQSVEEKAASLKREVNALSSKVDQLNATTMIEVDLHHSLS